VFLGVLFCGWNVFGYRPRCASVGGVCVEASGLWLVSFVLRKNGKKRGVSASGLFLLVDKRAVWRVRQVKRMCDRHCPHASLFVRVGGRDCFSRHHV